MSTKTIPDSPPQWIDSKQAHRLFSLGRTTLYRLASEKKIKTVSLQEKGMSRGKRLFSYSSIVSCLDSLATGPDPDAAPPRVDLSKVKVVS